MLNTNLKHLETADEHASAILDNEFAKTAQDQEISINGFSPLGCEVKANITVRSLDLNGEDMYAFRW
jgi:hypothetical protein